VAPTDSLPVVRYDTKAGERSLDMLRWGLVPFWAKDLNVGFANINAKRKADSKRRSSRSDALAAPTARPVVTPPDSGGEWRFSDRRPTTRSV
jgi:putative SOS response-associated peptidase YedK